MRTRLVWLDANHWLERRLACWRPGRVVLVCACAALVMAALTFPPRARAAEATGAANFHRFLLPAPNIGDVTVLALKVKGKVTPRDLKRELWVTLSPNGHATRIDLVRNQHWIAFADYARTGADRAVVLVALANYSQTNQFSPFTARPSDLLCQHLNCKSVARGNLRLRTKFALAINRAHIKADICAHAKPLAVSDPGDQRSSRDLSLDLVPELCGRRNPNQIEFRSDIGVNQTQPLPGPGNDYSANYSLTHNSDGSYSAHISLFDNEPRGARLRTDGLVVIFGGANETGTTTPPGAQCQIEPIGSGRLRGDFCQWSDGSPLRPVNLDHVRFDIRLDQAKLARLTAVMDIAKGHGQQVVPYDLVRLH